MHIKINLMFFLAVVAAVVSACSSIPVSSFAKLSRVDFLKTDLDRLRVALTLPAQIKPGKNGVVLAVNYALDGEKPQNSSIFLEESKRDADRVGLPPVVGAGQKTYAYRLSAREALRFDGIRKQIEVDKAQNKQGALDIAVLTKEFCASGALADGPVYVTIYISSVETEGYVVASRDLDLRKDKATATVLKQLKPC
jgi:hypothetical protein